MVPRAAADVSAVYFFPSNASFLPLLLLFSPSRSSPPLSACVVFFLVIFLGRRMLTSLCVAAHELKGNPADGAAWLIGQ